MMKQIWGLDRNNVLRPTPGDPWGVEQHHWNTRAKENQELNPGGPGNRQKKLRPQPTKVNSFMSGHQWVWRPTHWRAIKKGSNAINRDTVKHLACRLSLLTVIGLNTKHADCRIIFMLYPKRL